MDNLKSELEQKINEAVTMLNEVRSKCREHELVLVAGLDILTQEAYEEYDLREWDSSLGGCGY